MKIKKPKQHIIWLKEKKSKLFISVDVNETKIKHWLVGKIIYENDGKYCLSVVR